MRRVAACLFVLGVALAGCGDDGSSAVANPDEAVIALEAVGFQCEDPKPFSGTARLDVPVPEDVLECKARLQDHPESTYFDMTFWRSETDREASLPLLIQDDCAGGGEVPPFVASGRWLGTVQTEDGKVVGPPAEVLEEAARALGVEVTSTECSAQDAGD